MTTDTYTTTGLQSWVVPAGVTSIDAGAWASGGGGGNTTSGRGGGGGAYSGSTGIPVTPGETLYFNVPPGGAGGADGGDAWVSRNSDGSSPLILAKGGAKGVSTTTQGAGGAAASGVGTTKFSGGLGG